LTVVFHDALDSTKRERDDKPLGIGCVGRGTPKIIARVVLLPWSTSFEDPIPLPDCLQLFTLRDAASYITHLSKAEHAAPEWQLILVAENDGPTMLARIGVMRALNRGHVREFTEPGEKHHWGRRKLKRDQ
jgi:hypothetical protein